MPTQPLLAWPLFLYGGKTLTPGHLVWVIASFLLIKNRWTSRVTSIVLEEEGPKFDSSEEQLGHLLVLAKIQFSSLQTSWLGIFEGLIARSTEDDLTLSTQNFFKIESEKNTPPKCENLFQFEAQFIVMWSVYVCCS